MTSGPQFESCYVALLAALWAELEAILDAAIAAHSMDGALDRAALRAQALLLELVVLGERCESDTWRGLMGAAQAERVSGMVAALREALRESLPALGTPDFREAVERSQDALFDEVHRLASGVEQGAEQPVRRSA